MEHKPRGYVSNGLSSQVKVFGESREAFLQKGSLAAGGKRRRQKSVSGLPEAKALPTSNQTVQLQAACQ